MFLKDCDEHLKKLLETTEDLISSLDQDLNVFILSVTMIDKLMAKVLCSLEDERLRAFPSRDQLSSSDQTNRTAEPNVALGE